MRIYLGLALQDGHLPRPTGVQLGTLYTYPTALLRWLEGELGLQPASEEVDHLRVEQYRQALRQYLKAEAAAFFADSYQADDLGTAATLLAWRDELLGAGWDFCMDADTPPRLRVLATVESYWANPELALQLYAGETDRACLVWQQAERAVQLIDELYLLDERSYYPPFWQRFFTTLESHGLVIKTEAAVTEAAGPTTDLGRWQAFLRGAQTVKTTLRGDGSLLLLQGFRETHLSAYVAQLLRQHPDYRPSLLLPQANATLDNALRREGLPSLGIPSSSLARPSLQVLKLASVFLWDPIDPYKIMEFVSLRLKPLEDGLAQRIALFLADTPGLFSGRWFGMIRDYLEEELPNRAAYNKTIKVAEVQQQYNFWFRRKRVNSRTERVAKEDARAIYAYLQNWAAQLAREEEATTLHILAKQARKIVELLDALPEDQLGFLELERIIRTIYEPAPLAREAEAAHLPHVHQTGAVIGPVTELIWWDCFEQEPNYFFSHWYPAERAYLAAQQVKVESPTQQNDRLVEQRKRPVLHTQNRLLLCSPDFCDGKATTPHPLLGDLLACFGEDLSPICLHVDHQTKGAAWNAVFERLPASVDETPAPLARPQAFLQVPVTDASDLSRDEETPTSLEQLLYYPYQWVLRHHIQLRQSSILSVVQDNRLFGNLAHRVLENLLRKPDWATWSKAQLHNWIDVEIPSLLEKEGATLLLYGREPERIAFAHKMKFAAWSLVHLLRENGWDVQGTEEVLEGKVGPIHLRGRADLVLRRGDEHAIVDLKYRGISRYRNVLTSEEDIQLGLYAYLLGAADTWAHTAYYIIDKGQLLLRNNAAFQGIQPVQNEAEPTEIYQRMLDQLTKTYDWRKAQLAKGQVEVRCAATADELEETFGGELLDLLEMKQEDAYFDDYRVLIGLVE
ncbi:MAG: PD-(D/E)XK nuclease family protein [Bacteroidota bacterium]